MPVTDKEYLQRELVTEAEYHISNNDIKIECSHTAWVKTQRIKNNLTKNQLLDLYKKVYRLAKNQNITIGRKNHFKNYIVENWNKYIDEIEHYNNLFNQLITECKKVKQRGIHNGTIDDQVLDKSMDIRNEYNTVFYRNSIYSKIHNIYRRLTELYNKLSKDNYITKIVL